MGEHFESVQRNSECFSALYDFEIVSFQKHFTGMI